MTRRSYKKMWRDEKHRRELYEQWCPELREKYAEFARTGRALLYDMERILLNPAQTNKEARRMKGLLGWVSSPRVEEL